MNGLGRIARTTAANALVLALAAPVCAATPDDYFLAQVADARRGNVERAVATLLSWPDEQLVAYSSSPLTSCTGPCLRAAALLFTEVGVLHKEGASKKAREGPRKAAERIVDSLHDDDFARRRRLAVGYWHQQWGEAREALSAYSKYDMDPDALVAEGSVYEQVATIGVGGGGFRGIGFSSHHLEDAADRYQRALTLQPTHPEARLRLARVLQRRGQNDAARERFTALAGDEAVPSIVRGYACLFLGEMEQKADRLEPALERFRQAVVLDPLLQPAHLSLSQALHQSGRVREAGDAMLTGLRATSNRQAHGWFSYHAIALHGFRLSMDALWAEVRE